jgi:hypothetical protein
LVTKLTLYAGDEAVAHVERVTTVAWLARLVPLYLLTVIDVWVKKTTGSFYIIWSDTAPVTAIDYETEAVFHAIRYELLYDSKRSQKQYSYPGLLSFITGDPSTCYPTFRAAHPLIRPPPSWQAWASPSRAATSGRRSC